MLLRLPALAGRGSSTGGSDLVSDLKIGKKLKHNDKETYFNKMKINSYNFSVNIYTKLKKVKQIFLRIIVVAGKNANTW